MFKFIFGVIVGVIALAYYPSYIGNVKSVANNAAKAVVEATEDPSVIDQAKSLIK